MYAVSKYTAAWLL